MNQQILSFLNNEDIDIQHLFDLLPQRTQAHCRSVADVTLLLMDWAEEAEIREEAAALDRVSLKKAVLYHDIGLALIPTEISEKTGDLSGAEYRVLERHTTYGGRLLENYQKCRRCPPGERRLWQIAAEVAVSHHERWDGRGYPHGLKTTASTLLSRATAIADTYDAILRGSHYRIPLPPEYAALEIVSNAGKQFDPALAALFQSHMIPLISAHTQSSERLETGGTL